MTIELNGKTLQIPDAEIQRSMKAYSLSQDEAIQMWLEDEGYLENIEQNELCKLKFKLIGEKEKPKKRKAPTKKVDEVKLNLIKELANFLEGAGHDPQITNPTKIIEFDVHGEKFKLDLIKIRKNKEEVN